MIRTSSQRTKIRIGSLSILVWIAVVAFQNCGTSISVMDGQLSKMGGGNGEGYDSMGSHAGVYYHIRPGFTCGGGTSPSPSLAPAAGIVSILSITGSNQNLSGELKDACTGVRTNVDMSQVRFSTVRAGILEFSGNNFARFGDPPNLASDLTLIPVAICQTREMLDLSPASNGERFSRELVILKPANAALGSFTEFPTDLLMVTSDSQGTTLKENLSDPSHWTYDLGTMRFTSVKWMAEFNHTNLLPEDLGILRTPIPNYPGTFRFSILCRWNW